MHQISIDQTALASRCNAARLREELADHLMNEDRLVFDLRKVVSISESYSDELFGVLAAQIGLEHFQNKIEILVQSETVLSRIARSIHYRLKAHQE